MKENLKLVLFDFNGVLSNSKFYSSLEKDDKNLHSKVISTVFFNENLNLVNKWMRGDISYLDVNSYLSFEMGVDSDYLNNQLIESVYNMKLNNDIITLASNLKQKGIKVAVLTDNMDVFEKFLVPKYDLNSVFDYIFTSNSYKKLKLDDNASLLSDIFDIVGVKARETLLVDDSDDIGFYMHCYGGNFYLYEKYTKAQYKDLLLYLSKNFNFYL